MSQINHFTNNMKRRISRSLRSLAESFDNPIARPVKKIMITVAGIFIISLGLILFILPGSAVLFIPIGLGILALEYPIARKWLRKFQKLLSSSAKKADAYFTKRSRTS